MRPLLCAALSLVPVVTAACINNSGGFPPPGEPIEFERVTLDNPLSCQIFDDRAFLLGPGESLDEFFRTCTGVSTAARAELEAEVDQLPEAGGLIVTVVQLGGCIEEHAIVGVYLDGETLLPWVLKGDAAYGTSGVACPADIGEATELVRVPDRRGATTAEPWIGMYNPNLPGAPALPGD